MERLTKQEKAFCRKYGITSADIFPDGGNGYGYVWGLYNPFYYVRLTVSGYTKNEIYRLLVRALIAKCGIMEQ